MLSQSKTVIYIQESSLTAFKIKGDALTKQTSFDFDQTKIIDIFATVKKDFPGPWRVLIAQEPSYLKVIKIPSESKSPKEDIDNQIAEIIPNNLDSLILEWKQIGKDSKQKTVQVFVLPKQLCQNIEIASHQNQIKIKSVKPIASVLANYFKKEPSAHLIVFTFNNQTTAIIAQKGLAYISTNISQNNQINDMILSTGKDFGLQIDSAYYNNDAVMEIKNTLSTLGIKTEGKDTNSFFTSSVKTPTGNMKKSPTVQKPNKPNKEKPTEEEKNNQQSKKIKTEPTIFLQNENKKTTKPASKPSKKMLLIFPAIIILVAGFLWLKSGSKQRSTPSTSEEQTVIKETVKEEASEQTNENAEESQKPTEETIDPKKRFDLSIQVLNGTGGPGIAKEGMFFLEDLGYTNVDKDNADEFDYQKTEIHLQEQYLSLFDPIYQDLANEYTVDKEPTTLSGENEFDIMIIIGED
jgi:hypothetical protein